MNKKQKALVILWMIATLAAGIFTTYAFFHYGHHWVSEGNELIERPYKTEAVLSAWSTITLIFSALFALFTSRKSN